MKKQTSYEALLAMVVGSLILFFVLDKIWLAYLALGLGLTGLIIRPFTGLADWIWHKLTRALGFVSTHILLTVVFYGILAPVSFFYRRSKKDAMMLKKGRTSLFIERNHRYERKDLEKPW